MWCNCLFHVTLFSWQYHNPGSLWAPLRMIGWILRSILLSPTDSLLECPGPEALEHKGLMRTSSIQEAEGTTEAHRCPPLQAGGGQGWQKRKRAIRFNRKGCSRQPQLDSNLKLLVDQSTLECGSGDAGSRAGRDVSGGSSAHTPGSSGSLSHPWNSREIPRSGVQPPFCRRGKQWDHSRSLPSLPQVHMLLPVSCWGSVRSQPTNRPCQLTCLFAIIRSIWF